MTHNESTGTSGGGGAISENRSVPKPISEKDLERDLEKGINAAAENTDGDHSSTDKSSVPKEKTEPRSAAEEDEAGKVYPPLRQVIPIIMCLLLSLFLVSLDRTILSTAVPSITNEFHSINDIGWYASSYLITGCAVQLLFGKIYTFYSPKWVFIASVALFEIGSLICGVAQNSTMFIIGRAIAGLGSAGLMSGSVVLLLHILPLRQRPILMALMGAVFLVSSIVGPIMGGALTTKASWRWCFYINLPVGGVTILLIMWLLPDNQNQTPEEREARTLSARHKIEHLDPPGTILFLPGIVCLLLALEWGGSAYSWGNWRIILLFIVFGFLIIAFTAIQLWKPEHATLPPRIVKYRSVTSTAVFSFFTSGSMMTLVYFLPVWFQAIKGSDALSSGYQILPLILSLIVSSIIAAPSVSKIGYYTPFLIACSIIMAVGAGLIMTFKVDTRKAIWIGYQVVYGIGTGLGQQQAGLAAQTVLPVKDVPVGVSYKFFAQNLGGAIFVSVGQNVLSNKLVSGLAALGLPDFDPQVIISLGATELKDYVGTEYIDRVLVVYNDALDGVFMLVMILAALSLVPALLTEWKSIKGKNIKGA